MTDDVAPSLIARAETAAFGHIAYLKRRVKSDLYFTSLLFVINLINYEAIFSRFPAFNRFEAFMAWMPPPILLIALAVSVIYLYMQLSKINVSLGDLSHLVDRPEPAEARTVRSLTDINYALVDVVEKSLRIWSYVALLFIVYILTGSITILAYLRGRLPGYELTPPNVLNLATFILAIAYFCVQTVSWWKKRKQMRTLTEMERTVKEELKI